MTEFEWTQLRTLLWKEWRQVRGLFFMVLAILAGGPLYLAWVEGITQDTDSFLVGLFQIAAFLGALGFGVLSYGLEFNDHTDQYLATRPLAHPRTFLVKTGLGLALSAAVGLVASIATLLVARMMNQEWTYIAGEIAPYWWILGPCIYLAVMTAILAIPPIIPSLIAACLIALGMVAMSMKIWALPVLLAPVFLFLSYQLAYRRVYLAPAR
ncbi:MAG: hypothetical protein KC944_18850 [Candidatus Omnitrophica bacterium]|nr:hypothetical protein [Candidatus Omnitrophota bacterium]MCA9443171.1 hypothetical protein [Candidatus Omnitrophota bacterium]MCB9769369.1 hypothetical protein [Candidatus Omnitrophota bacterium]